MRWRPAGGPALLTWRALGQSERFERAGPLLVATYQRSVVLPQKVIAFRRLVSLAGLWKPPRVHPDAPPQGGGGGGPSTPQAAGCGIPPRSPFDQVACGPLGAGTLGSPASGALTSRFAAPDHSTQ